MFTAFNTTEELRRGRPRIAILPVGATEQHSNHLPLATDTLFVEAVGQRVAKRLKAYCLPALPFSVSHMHRGCKGTVWLRNETLVAVIRDVANSVRHDGFKVLVLLNGHGGNFILTPIVQDLNMDHPDLLTFTFDAWGSVVASGIFPGCDAGMMHGDEFETSCMLYLRPDAVKRNRIRDRKGSPDRELLRYFPFAKFSKLTHTGTPSRSSAEQGRRAIECMVDHSVKTIQATLQKVRKYKKL